MNVRKLRGKLVEKGLLHKEIAAKDCWDCALCTVSQKISGYRPMTLDEANTLGEKLELTTQEYYDIFFGN